MLILLLNNGIFISICPYIYFQATNNNKASEPVASKSIQKQYVTMFCCLQFFFHAINICKNICFITEQFKWKPEKPVQSVESY